MAFLSVQHFLVLSQRLNRRTSTRATETFSTVRGCDGDSKRRTTASLCYEYIEGDCLALHVLGQDEVPGRCAPVELSRAHSAAQTRCRRPGDSSPPHTSPRRRDLYRRRPRMLIMCVLPSTRQIRHARNTTRSTRWRGQRSSKQRWRPEPLSRPYTRNRAPLLELANLPSAALDRLRNRDTCRLTRASAVLRRGHAHLTSGGRQQRRR